MNHQAMPGGFFVDENNIKALPFRHKKKHTSIIIIRNKEVYEITVFYVDVFLFIHFFSEYILLRIISKIMLVKSGRFRSLVAAFFAGSFNVLLFFAPMPAVAKYILTYIVVVCFELLIAFPGCKIRTYAELFGILYLLSFVMGGFLRWIFGQSGMRSKYGIHVMWLVASMYFLSSCIIKMHALWRREKQLQNDLRWVKCKVNGTCIECTGLWDTGNSLYDPLSGKPVLIIEKNEVTKYGIHIKKEQYRIIPYHSLGTRQGILEAFIADEVQIFTMNGEKCDEAIEREKVMVGVYEGKLSQDGAFQMILHPGM